MDPSALNWDLCRSFLAVMSEGNLSRAARTLGLTQPTLGRHIDEIEAALGSALFTRSQQGLAPTDAAFELKPHALAMAAAADALVRSASGNAAEARGVVRVTAPEFLGGEFMPSILTRFHEAYPEVIIELALTNVTENLLQREADIAVRMVRPEQTGLFARLIGKVRFGLYAHRSYLKKHPAPRTLSQLSNHTLVGFDRKAAAIQALREMPNAPLRESFAFRSDNPMAQLAVVREGYGIGRCPEAIARRYPDLVAVMPDDYSVEVDLWVAMHEDARNSRRTRLMFDHLATSLAAATSGKLGPRAPGAGRKGAKV